MAAGLHDRCVPGGQFDGLLSIDKVGRTRASVRMTPRCTNASKPNGGRCLGKCPIKWSLQALQVSRVERDHH